MHLLYAGAVLKEVQDENKCMSRKLVSIKPYLLHHLQPGWLELHIAPNGGPQPSCEVTGVPGGAERNGMDKYDKAVAYLTERPMEIWEAWHDYFTHEAGCLFGRCSKFPCDISYGCLTQVRLGMSIAETPSLTKAIRNSRSLPKQGDEIKVKHLPLFAKWQRRIDKELGRVI